MHVLSALRLCIVGAGPGGLYVAERLFKRLPEIRVDVLDRLPFPFGLVETGVAPDHSATKNVRRGFIRLLEKPGCHFYGHVQLGRDVDIQQLTRYYHGVILACGAEADRKLEVEGEQGRGIYSARDFVWWYNGHPDGSPSIDLSPVRTAAIIGAGNVAIDCARILLKPWDAFVKTDMASRAIEGLRHSAVRDVYLLARRGAAHVKFTPKELRELVHLPDVRLHLQESDLELSVSEQSMIDKHRMKKRVQAILHEAMERSKEQQYNQEPYKKQLHFLFSKRVHQIHLNADAYIQSIALRDTRWDDALKKLDVGLLIHSIGTVAVPIEGVPFDVKRGIVPNIEGRVRNPETGKIVEGVYVSGWLKRGASGIIGTNVLDAEEVTDSIVHDAPRLHNRDLSRELLREELTSKGVRFVNFEQWKKLMEVEQRRGSEMGKEREKIVDLDEMLKICGNGYPH